MTRKTKNDYPVQSLDAQGRRLVAMDNKGQPAKRWEQATGWVFHPSDLPVHGRKGKRK